MSADQAAHLAQVAGPWTLVLGLVMAGLYAILGGGLVPRATLERELKQYSERLAESKERELAWRSVAETKLQADAEQTEQVGKLMVLGETTVALLRALPSPRTPT